MTWQEYTYRCLVDPEIQGMNCDTAFVPVKIMRGKETFSTEGFIDSGGAGILASCEIAEFLEIDLSHVEPRYIAGIGGYFVEAKMAKVLVHVDDLGEPFEDEVAFIENLKVPVLLGQSGFFDRFNVRFEKHKNKFFVQRIVE